jgi:hypothetical protein
MRKYLPHILIISFVFLLVPNVQAELHHSEYPSCSILPPHLYEQILSERGFFH